MESDVPEELAAEIPDPKHFQMWVTEDDDMSFSFGGMNVYETVGRLRFLLDAIEAGHTESVDEDE